MEKQKIIEEMNKANKDLMGLCKLLFENWDGTVINAAKTVLEHYQPKIPEGRVALSSEEYEAMKTDRQNLVNKYNQADEAVDYWCERFKNASKETAEKLLNEIYWLVARRDTINVLTRIQEIATREGIEIKE